MGQPTPRLLTELRLRIHLLHKQLRKLEDILMKPKSMVEGSIRILYLRCGKKHCACKKKKNPKKHGPYVYRRVMVNGKQKSIYIKEEKTKEQLENYRGYNKHLSEYRKIMKKIYDTFDNIRGMYVKHDAK